MQTSYSPVIRTRASIPPQSSFRAVTGVRVKTSRLAGEGGVLSASSFGEGNARPLSSEGSGRGGRIKVSTESWIGSVPLTKAADDMSPKNLQYQERKRVISRGLSCTVRGPVDS